MSVLRSDIERALDDLISNQEGMRFQGLAVILAKKRWPDFIASERMKDLGADAIGSGKVLACSLTAKLYKIQSDATKIKKHFDDITKLVFATPDAVTNTMATRWAEEIRRDFDYELVVMSREDIITSLMDPSNAALCGPHLGLPVEVAATFAELVQQIREAVSEVTTGWSLPLKGKPLIELRAIRVDQVGRDAAELFSIREIRAALARSRPIMLEASAGSGKTTTLVQLASGHSDSGDLTFLIDLPIWVQSRKDILQFIGKQPAFKSRALSAEMLARLYRVQRFTFLLNGWNEIAESDSVQAILALRKLVLDFPLAGILVATRTHHIVPPIPNALRLRLLPVNETQRAHYLQQRLGNRSEELRSILDSDPVLDELTQTPLILSEVTTLFEVGEPIPRTKMGVLASAVRLHERSEKHSSHLTLAPIEGRAREYLAALATAMTEAGAGTMTEESAREIVFSATAKLHDAGQLQTPPEPSAIVNALCAHHVLVRVSYPPDTLRFVHQQFQEFFVASRLKRQVIALANEDGEQRVLEFTKLYVNHPTYTEQLRMVAEDIGAESLTPPDDLIAVKSGALLIGMALRCDRVYAADLSYLCGPSVWKEVRGYMAEQLRSLYQAPDQPNREIAVAGMLATGSSDFLDIIYPLLTSEDQQVRLNTFRTLRTFHLSSLGPDWQKMVSAWSEEGRAEFVSELIHFGNAAPTLAPFALSDSSLKVRVAAISALAWVSSREATARLLQGLDDDTFEAVVQEFPTEVLPASIRPRALAAFGNLYSEASQPVGRLRILLHIVELGGVRVASQMKDELSKCELNKVTELARFLTKPVLEAIRQTDAEWVSYWVAGRIAVGALEYNRWSMFVTTKPQELNEQLLQKLETEDRSKASYLGSVSMLVAYSDATLVQRLFAKLCQLRQLISGSPDQRHETEWAIERQLEEVFRAIPSNVAVDGLSGVLSGEVDAIEMIILTGLFGRVGLDNSGLRTKLDGNLKQTLRAYLIKCVPVMLRQDDFSGEQKANLACALSQVGEPEDMNILRRLIQADIERVRRGRQVRARGGRDKMANGAAMSYANWHVRAVVLLDSGGADKLLLDVLKEPEYERDASGTLVQLARTSIMEENFGKKKDYKDIWGARAGRLPSGFDEKRRRCYADAIGDRIADILKEGDRTGRTDEFRLRELTKTLAVVDASGSTDLIFRALGTQGRFNGWQAVETIEALLFNGVILPTETTFKLFDSILERARAHLYSNQEVGLLMHALCLLPFVENAPAGVQKVREVIVELRIPTHQLRDVAIALGNSRCHEALEVLRELASDEAHTRSIEDSWLNAIAALDIPEARQLLLSFVDPEIRGLPFEMRFRREDIITARLVELAHGYATVERHLLELCDLRLPPPKRLLLAKVISSLGTPEAVVDGLSLIDDDSTPAIPYEILKRIEETFVEHKPSGKDTNSYTLAPRSSNSVRTRLFEMATKDKGRMRSASLLLGRIEVWRIEHGRPNGEPRSLDIEFASSWPTRPVARLQFDTASAG